jgi:hypothetical protein
MNKCSKLAEDTHVFTVAVEEVRSSSSADRMARRRLDNTHPAHHPVDAELAMIRKRKKL